MTARAIWQGNLIVQKHEIAVKLYSAVVDRQIHFHLLHKRDARACSSGWSMLNGKARPAWMKPARRLKRGPALVAVSSEEIERSVAEPSRKVGISRFVPNGAIDPQFFDRPYYLGPLGDSQTDYLRWRRPSNERRPPASRRGLCASTLTWAL